MSYPIGRELVEHMQEKHGYVVWNPPAPNTNRYKQWKAAHLWDSHGRWADQQDHSHVDVYPCGYCEEEFDTEAEQDAHMATCSDKPEQEGDR